MKTLKNEDFINIMAELKNRLAIKNLRVPEPKDSRSIEWRAEKHENNTRVKFSAKVPIENFCVNLQEDRAAVASFLLALAYWYEKINLGVKTECHIQIKGSEPSSNKDGLLHWRRSLFLLQEYSKYFNNFTYDSPSKWSWPSKPVLNTPSHVRKGGDKSKKQNGRFSERSLEAQIEDRFCDHPIGSSVSLPENVSAQLPVGLFKEGVVKSGNEWTVARTSEIDLWGKSRDGETLHLFELKGCGNKKIGIIPEAFYYASLIGYIREKFPPSKDIQIDCDSNKKKNQQGFKAAKVASKITMWLIAPNDEYHPLVLNQGKSPLENFNSAMKPYNIEFKILPYTLDDQKGFVGWIHDKKWPEESDSF